MVAAVGFGGGVYAGALERRQRLDGAAHGVAAARAHFDEDEAAVVLRDYVNFALAAAEVAVEDDVALRFQVGDGESLAEAAEADALVAHAGLPTRRSRTGAKERR